MWSPRNPPPPSSHRSTHSQSQFQASHQSASSSPMPASIQSQSQSQSPSTTPSTFAAPTQKLKNQGKRIAQVVRLKPDCVTKYKECHARVWPEVLKQIKDCCIEDSYHTTPHQQNVDEPPGPLSQNVVTTQPTPSLLAPIYALTIAIPSLPPIRIILSHASIHPIPIAIPIPLHNTEHLRGADAEVEESREEDCAGRAIEARLRDEVQGVPCASLARGAETD
ncbi:hypothetical protein NHQ30_005989 [Ciborinia camelliae]|nr:hypothetical protein NHQ30_005989 [Ciborinia camelliae]